MKNNEIENKLQQIISKEKGSWLEDAQYRADNRKWLKRSQAIALTIIRTLRAEGLNQKDFAAKMGLSAQQVNKWLKGRQNFTFETIAKIEVALNIELMDVVSYETNQKSKNHSVITPDYSSVSVPTSKMEKKHSEPAKMIPLYPNWGIAQNQA